MSALDTPIYRDLLLHESKDKFYLESPHQDPNRRLLQIDRVTHEVAISENAGQLLTAEISNRIRICGLLGIIDLNSGPCLVVAVNADKIGDITSANHGVYRVIFILCDFKIF